MVVPHKLKKAQLDVAIHHGLPTPANSLEEIGHSTATTSTSAQSSAQATASQSRPATRSQTGRPAKRRILENNALDDESLQSNRAPAAKKRKRTISTSAPAPTLLPAPVKHASQPPPLLPPPLPTAQRMTPPRDPSPPQPSSSKVEDNNVPITTMHIAIGNKRGPRSRANLPIPVPNVTKKSRGRRVPIAKDGLIITPAVVEDTQRAYVCQVEGCGKCFYRGEHLKRHIRSIHTHEKPFACTHSGCDKFFNRHDNLLQHLKIHASTSSTKPSLPPSPLNTSMKQRPLVRGPAEAGDAERADSDSDGAGERTEPEDEDDGPEAEDDDESERHSSPEPQQQQRYINTIYGPQPLESGMALFPRPIALGSTSTTPGSYLAQETSSLRFSSSSVRGNNYPTSTERSGSADGAGASDPDADAEADEDEALPVKHEEDDQIPLQALAANTTAML